MKPNVSGQWSPVAVWNRNVRASYEAAVTASGYSISQLTQLPLQVLAGDTPAFTVAHSCILSGL